MKKAMTLNTMLRALEQTVNEGDPFLVHARTLYHMSTIPPTTSRTDFAYALTKSLRDYLVLYAADAYGATEDYVVFPKTVTADKVHEVIAVIKEEPNSSCGDGSVPDWVEEWIDDHRQ